MIIERKKEQEILKNLANSNKSEFLAVYGRRRIGKTFLISNFFNKSEYVYLEFIGLKKGTDEAHRDLFIDEIATKLNEDLYDKETQNWRQIFRILQGELTKIQDKKIVIFIDELPRFCKNKKDLFLEQLAYFWEHYISKRNDMILVVSGSSASWMIEHIINETGTLYDRITEEMELKPLTLKETKSYLFHKGIKLEDKNIAEIYMAIGGIPKYLDYIQSGDSFFTAINRLFFQRSARLRVEFNKLFKSLYQSKANQYKHLLIKTFSSSHTIGKTIDEIVTLNLREEREDEPALTRKTIERIVEDLVACGFLLKQEPIARTKGNGGHLYFLIDSYSIFYIYWIHNKPTTSDDEFWIKQIDTPNWNSWKGYAFESICLMHEKTIKELLGISGMKADAYGWAGAKQIDLILDRSDDCINIFELKFYKEKYSISSEYLADIESKIKAFKMSTKTKKSIIPVMITSYGCVHNEHYKSIIAKEITLYEIMNS